MKTNIFDKLRFFEDNCVVFDDCYGPIGKKRNIENYISKQAKGVISQDNDISYLVEIPDLFYVSIPRDVENIQVIMQLNSLKALKLYSSSMNKIDISHMKDLEYLHIIEDELLSNFVLPKSIKSLYFQGFGFKNLLSLKSFIQLRELYIDNSSKLVSIEGIENFKDINVISLDYCTKLKGVEELSIVGKSLKALRLIECNKVGNFDFLHNLKEMTHLNVVNSHSKSPIIIPNIDFVIPIKLEEYVCNFKIEDGNLKPLLTTSHSEVFNFYSNYNLIDKDLPKRYVVYQDSKYSGKKVSLSELKLGKDDPNIIWSK